LFDRSHRPDKLVMPACHECNGGTSTADLTVAIVSRWDYNSSPQERADHKRLAARVRKQAPVVAGEWTQFDRVERTKARLHLINQGVPVPRDAEVATIGPLTVCQLNLFAHKAVLALYFQHFRQPLSDTGRFCGFWRSKEDFARDGIPRYFFEIFPAYATLEQGRWNESETFEYRHAINAEEGLFGCLARLRQRFFIFGFAVRDATALPPADADWVKPSELMGLVATPRFQKKR
jgi:hypothetical protein